MHIKKKWLDLFYKQAGTQTAPGLHVFTFFNNKQTLRAPRVIIKSITEHVWLRGDQTGGTTTTCQETEAFTVTTRLVSERYRLCVTSSCRVTVEIYVIHPIEQHDHGRMDEASAAWCTSCASHGVTNRNMIQSELQVWLCEQLESNNFTQLCRTSQNFVLLHCNFMAPLTVQVEKCQFVVVKVKPRM